jgi:hypothetical protein
MNDEKTAERIQYFRDVATEHGYQTVPTATVYRTFRDVVQPTQLGFSEIKTSLYGKPINDDITHLISFQALKGAGYTVRWGVSLAYMPHKWSPKPQWHRSLKSSRFDLFETPFDYLHTHAIHWRESEAYIAYTLYGKSFLRGGVVTMWGRVKQDILAWFASVLSLDGVLKKAEEQMGRKWAGPRHYPEPMRVCAFTLARMGRFDEARAALGRFYELGYESSESQVNLGAALKEVAAVVTNAASPPGE